MRLLFVYAIVVILALAVYAVRAFAADGAIPALSILDAVRPYLVEIGGVLILAFVTWLSSWLRATFKVSLDESHRAALHSALENGARLALEKLDKAAASRNLPVGHPLIETGVQYVLTYSPDAVAHFGLTPARLGELLRAKLITAEG